MDNRLLWYHVQDRNRPHERQRLGSFFYWGKDKKFGQTCQGCQRVGVTHRGHLLLSKSNQIKNSFDVWRRCPYNAVTKGHSRPSRGLSNQMSFLFIGTTGDRAGHSLFAWAMVRRLVEKGLTVGFLKPFGSHPIYDQGRWTDPDALLFKRVLGLSEPLDRLCSYLHPEEAWAEKGADEIIGEIRSLAEELSAGRDVLLIMGSRRVFFDDVSCGVSDILLTINLEADFVLIDRYWRPQTSIYSILSVSSLLKDRLKGIVLNRVPPERLGMVKDEIISSLTRKRIPIATAVPEDPLLCYWTLGEIRDLLDGEFLWAEQGPQRWVGGMTVGSHDLTDDVGLLKRLYNKIILLTPTPLESKGDGRSARRPIAGILLTGGRRPAPQVLEAAKKAHIPLILTQGDNFAALERLEQATPGLSPDDEAKVRRFTELMDEDGVLNRMIGSLGLGP